MNGVTYTRGQSSKSTGDGQTPLRPQSVDGLRADLTDDAMPDIPRLFPFPRREQ